MPDQSPQLSHERARDSEAQQSEHEPAPGSSESVPPAENGASDDGANGSETESVDEEGGIGAKEVKSPGSDNGKAIQDGDQGKKDGEEEVDDEDDESEDEEGDDDEEEDEDDDDDDDEEDDEDEDEEPKLKYARLTQHLNGVYRNGDATSAFLVAGDKMVSSMYSGSERYADSELDCWNA